MIDVLCLALLIVLGSLLAVCFIHGKAFMVYVTSVAVSPVIVQLVAYVEAPEEWALPHFTTMSWSFWIGDLVPIPLLLMAATSILHRNMVDILADSDTRRAMVVSFLVGIVTGMIFTHHNMSSLGIEYGQGDFVHDNFAWPLLVTASLLVLFLLWKYERRWFWRMLACPLLWVMLVARDAIFLR